VYCENYSARQEVEMRKLQKTFRIKNSVFLNITFVSWFLCCQIVERMYKLHTFCDQSMRIKPRRLEWITVGYYIIYKLKLIYMKVDSLKILDICRTL
jgi:hypothetical protein